MIEINTSFICIGLFAVIFIICISLMIFAPKSVNYFIPETYPALKMVQDTSKDILDADLNNIIEEDKTKRINWLDWPDKGIISGECKIFPLYMLGKLSSCRAKACANTYNLIQSIPNIITCAFIKLAKKSKINKSTLWADVANTTLRCLLPIRPTSATSVEKRGMWVNGETKKISYNNLLIFDSSKEHSIYNDSDYDLYALLIDINRLDNLPVGVSTKEYPANLLEFTSLF